MNCLFVKEQIWRIRGLMCHDFLEDVEASYISLIEITIIFGFIWAISLYTAIKLNPLKPREEH